MTNHALLRVLACISPLKQAGEKFGPLFTLGFLVFQAGLFSVSAASARDWPNEDRRPASSPALPDAAQAAGEARLRARLPKLQIDRAPRLTTPEWLHVRGGFLTGPGGQGGGMPVVAGTAPMPADQPRTIVRSFVSEHEAVFGHSVELLPDDLVTREFVSARHGLRTVQWEQRLDGLALYRCYFKAHVTQDGALVSLNDELMPQAEEAARPSDRQCASGGVPVPVTAREALLQALAWLGMDVDPAQVQPVGAPVPVDQMQVLSVPGARNPGRVQLIWIPWTRDSLRLGWRVWVTRPFASDSYEVLVDANTGEPVKRRCLTDDAGNATYRHYSGDSPTPMSPGLFVPSTNQPPVAARNLSTLTSVNGTASPDGWITGSDNTAAGNNASAIYWEQTSANSWSGHQVHGSPHRVFDFPLDLTKDPSTHQRASAVNAFYWVNWAHDRFYSLGFTEAAGNAQEDNFGRGGLGNDRVRVYVQDIGKENNASMATWPDGCPPEMSLGIYGGTTPRRDAALDAEIILHEYAHLVSNRMVGDGLGLDELQSRGMGEGWSDFFALALLSQSGDSPNGTYAFGGYVAKQVWGYPFFENYYFGIRRYPYSTDPSKNPLTFNDIDPDQTDLDFGIPTNPVLVSIDADEVHNQGEVWCALLWGMRAKLIQKFGFATGNTLAMQLVMDGMNLSPNDPTFNQARNAILQAELIDPLDAYTEVWDAFAQRGMGVGSKSPANHTTLGVVENFDSLDDLLVWPPQGATISGPVGGPFAPAGFTMALTNDGSAALSWRAHADLPLTISPASGIMPGGGRQNASLSVNAAAAASLPAGTRTSRVRFTNLVSGVVVERSFVFAVGYDYPPVEAFVGGSDLFDLENVTLTFTPDGAGQHYDVCRQAGGVANLPVDPNLGELLEIDSQSFSVQALANGKAFPYFGTLHSQIAVSDNGCVVLGGQHFDPLASSVGRAAHFAVPRISVFLANLNPDDYTIWWEQRSDQAVVTWVHGNIQSARFQLQLFFNGTIQMTYLDPEPEIGVCGLSRGQGAIFGFPELDISEAYPCTYIPLSLKLPSGVSEGDGRVAGAIEVSVPTASASARRIVLSSSDTTEINVPSFVSIPASATTASFDVTVVDDARRDGTQVSFIEASGPGLIPATGALPVHDNESVALHLDMPATMTEGAFFSVGEVSMSAPAHDPVGVPLYSLDTNELYMPPVVFIPAGQTSALFITWAINDNRIDGARNVLALAQVENWTNSFDLVRTLDNESKEIKLLTQTFFNESMGTVTNGGQVVFGGTLTTNLFVPLVSDDASEVHLGLWAIVEAGQSNAHFNVRIVDDAAIDGLQIARIRALADGYVPGTNFVWVGDNDGPPETMDPWPPHLSQDIPTHADLRWGPVEGDLVVNGDFETGTIAGWSRHDVGAGLWTVHRGTLDPASPDAPMPPLNGEFSALANPAGNGRHVLWQDVFIPIGATAADLSWTHMVRNHAGSFGPGQEFRVELRDPVTDEVLVTLFQTDPAHPAFGSVTNLAFDLLFYRNRRVRLAFVEEDAFDYLNVHLDDVSLQVEAAVPTTFHVHFGDQSGLGGPEYVGSTSEPFWPLPTLAAGQTYYWQVLSERGGVTNAGPLWRFTTEGSSADVDLIAFAATWNYFNTGQNLGTSWVDPGYDDSSWSSGRAPLGFGGQETTVVGAPNSPIVTYYFRRKFNIQDLSRVAGLTARLVRDDGAVVHLNGEAVIFNNMPRGRVDYRTEAERESLGVDETTVFTYELDPAKLVVGTNVVAVEVHQKHPIIGFSDDLAFNFRLTALMNVGNEAPQVTLTSPREDFSIAYHPGNVVLRAAVEDEDASHTVEFFANGASIGIDHAAPYALSWASPKKGLYRVTAVATDPGGLNAESEPLTVLVASLGNTLITVVPPGSEWLYLDSGRVPASSWTTSSFRQGAGWKTGSAQLGYGDGDETTVIGFGLNPWQRPITVWFRRVLTTPLALESLDLRALRDDGIVVYLNGIEIVRDNMPEGRIEADTRALGSVEGVEESVWYPFMIDQEFAAGLLQPGDNVLAVEVHQVSPTSADLSFDLELFGTGNYLPQATVIQPAAESVFLGPSQVQIVAEAVDPYGAVDQVEFFVAGSSLAVDATAPFEAVWTNPPFGIHQIHAVATDASGATNRSDSVLVEIGGEPVLEIGRQGEHLRLRWPGWAVDFVPHGAPNLVQPILWSPVPGTPVLAGEDWILEISGDQDQRYFRLVNGGVGPG